MKMEGENLKKTAFVPFFVSDFDLPNLYSNNIVGTDSDFKLTECSALEY